MSAATAGDPVVSLAGEVLELDIGPVAHGGHCVARYGGRVVFVRHTLPGERVRALVTEDGGGSYCRADAVDIVVPAPGRVTPPCPYAGPGRCGGCDFQHVAPAVQRSLKSAVVREQLQRLGGLTEAELAGLGLGAEAAAEELPGGALGWRTRVRFAVDRAGRAGLHPHRSNEVLPVDRCLIASPGVDSLGILDTGWPGATAVEGVVSSVGDRAVVVTPAAGRVTVPEALDPAVAVLDDGGRGAAKPLRGHARVRERAADRTWLVHAGGFWQVHPAAADTLTDAVASMLGVQPGEHVWDLYGGVGLFAGALAPAAGRVTVVESGAAAVADARRNLRDLPGVTVHHARVDAWLRRPSPAADVVVLDPPRTGAGKDVLRHILTGSDGRRHRPRRVAYVACDPAALGRDVRTARSLGWELTAVRVFDLFPMTQHIECVALLEPAAE
jgi:tRNA/tmRNA/rRNA uracil-C5-methylase (TrmA/RlmC/RlmD family)